MIGIFLDDERNPEDVTWVNYPENINWIVVRNYQEFISALAIPMTGYIISFDHDLQCFENGKEKTGYDCIKFLCGIDSIQNLGIKDVFFHTKNPIGLDNMKSYWDNYLKFKQEN